jgi:hypothetical protein
MPAAPDVDADTDHDPLVRPGWACALHAPPRQVGAWVVADSGYAVCDPCDVALRDRLGEVGARYLRLDSRPGGTGEYGSRGAPGFGSRPPLNLHIVALRDPRSSDIARVWMGRDGRVHRESERPPLSVHGMLCLQAWTIAEHRGSSYPDDRADEFDLLRYLKANLIYATRHAELVVDLDRAVRDLLGQLRPVTGDARRRIGLCPATIPNDDPATVEEMPDRRCGSVLFAPVQGAEDITCPVCETHWDRAAWLHLGDLLMQADRQIDAA